MSKFILRIVFVVLFMLSMITLYAQKMSKTMQKKVVEDNTPITITPSKSLYFKSDLTMVQFITELMSKMTLEEKIGQLNLPSAGYFVTGQTKNSNIGQKIKRLV